MKKIEKEARFQKQKDGMLNKGKFWLSKTYKIYIKTIPINIVINGLPFV